MAGKERSFGRGVLLTVVTFGLYSIYWHWSAHKELTERYPDRQFPTGTFICSFIPLIGIIFMIMTFSTFQQNLASVRHRLGLSPPIGVGAFILWHFLPLVGQLVAYSQLQGQINEVWQRSQMAPPPAYQAPIVAQ